MVSVVSEISAEVSRAAASGLYFDWHRGLAGPDSTAAIALRPQSMAVLQILYQNAGKAVTKEQLLSHVWHDVVVTDDSLVQCITEIRKAIGDVDRKIIKTLPKRGYIYDLPTDSTETAPPAAPSIPRRSWALPAVALAVVGLAFVAWSSRPVPQAVELPGIAVLPFNNLGNDPKGDKFAAMMTEDVITDLSHSKDFSVIARNSSDVYKGRAVDVRSVGQELHVKYVLEGSVEPLPGRVRATAQLIDVATNAHIWSERFEAQGDDVFAVEANVTNRIATSITGHDAAAANNERSLIRRKPPHQWDAYDAYQAGLEASHQMGPEFVPQAETMFTKAIKIDPNFARAHLGLAWVNLEKILYGVQAPDIALPKMLAEAKSAEALDPDDGEVHAALAQAYSMLNDPSKTQAEASRALILAPNNADILVLTSPFLIQSGQSDLAVDNINKALGLNPSYPFWYNSTLYPALFYAGDYARSYGFAQEAAKAAPVNSDFLAMDAAYLGRTDEAAQAKQALLKLDPEWSAERLLSNFGNLSGTAELERLTTGATKAGLQLCMSKAEVASRPDAIHLKSCDADRAKS